MLAALLFLTTLLPQFVTSAHSTTFVDRPFPSAVEEAPVIVRGKVGMSYANWAPAADGVRRIYTFYELAVDEVIKGNPPRTTLTMRELGGEIDGRGMQVSGTAQFERGEDVVVFLSGENPDGSYGVYGMMMAKFNLEKGDDGKEYLSGPAIGSGTNPALRGHEHEVYGHEDDHGGQDGTRNKVKWTLEDLRTLVKKQTGRPVTYVSPKPKSNVVAPIPSPVASGLTAPALQSSPPAEASDSAGLNAYPWIWISLGLAGLGLWLLFSRRQR
jgi:hypothetical protein